MYQWYVLIVVMNRTAMNMFVQMFLSTAYPGELLSHRRTAFIIRRCCQIISPSDVKIYTANDGGGEFQLLYFLTLKILYLTVLHLSHFVVGTYCISP